MEIKSGIQTVLVEIAAEDEVAIFVVCCEITIVAIQCVPVKKRGNGNFPVEREELFEERLREIVVIPRPHRIPLVRPPIGMIVYRDRRRWRID